MFAFGCSSVEQSGQFVIAMDYASKWDVLRPGRAEPDDERRRWKMTQPMEAGLIVPTGTA